MKHRHSVRAAFLGLLAVCPFGGCAQDGARDKPDPAMQDDAGTPIPSYPEDAAMTGDGNLDSGGGTDAKVPFGAPPAPTSDYLLDPNTATSKTTGLVWLRATLDTRNTGGSCVIRCGELTAAGRDDWRAPTLSELKNIVVMKPQCPLVDEDAFPLTLCSWYTSADTATGSGFDYSMVSFYSGDVKSMADVYKDTGFSCRCVR